MTTIEQYESDIISLWSKLWQDEDLDFTQYVNLNTQLRELGKTIKEYKNKPMIYNNNGA